MKRRRPWGRRMFWAIAVVLAAAWGSSTYVMRPSALQSRLVQLFRHFGLNVVRVGDISFSLWSGLTVENLEVDPPRAITSAGPIDSPSLLKIPEANVACDRWQLLAGRFVPREIVLLAPEITLVRPEPGSSLGWRIPEDTDASGSTWTPADLPAVRIQNGDLRLMTVQAGR